MMKPVMHLCQILAISMTLMGLMSVPLWAETIPGRWEKVTALAVTSPITVELKNGDRIKGNFGALSKSSLTLSTHSARAVIPKGGIQTITIHPRDSLANGLQNGAVVGAGFVCAIVAAMVTRGQGVKAAGVMLLIPVVAAAGAGIGGAVDAAMNARTIKLYEAAGTS
jgi:hypothetical protein